MSYNSTSSINSTNNMNSTNSSTRINGNNSPKRLQNPWKIYPKRLKNPWKRCLGEVLGGSGRLLEGSWRHLGPKMAPRAKKTPKGPPLDPQVGGQNQWKIDLKGIQNLIIFLIGCWIGFHRIWVPTWHQLGTQNLPKYRQVGCKIHSSWTMVLRAVFRRMLGVFLLIFRPKITLPT